jgi:hypothetical protein
MFLTQSWENTMIYLMRNRAVAIVRPRVVPDDAQASALQAKLAALDYTPLNGFHKDRKQDRRSVPRPALRSLQRSA